ncbi:hypothetical protein H7Y40_00455 [Pedobacter sp.]|nr:hypothetical protein [Candidatus Saccharibacteria bacterium]
MRIYFSGIGGVGIGPLAEIALDAGYDVVGSDLKESAFTRALVARGATVFIGQDGSQIKNAHEQKPIEWFVFTAALPDNHPELVFAAANNIRQSKRDELLATIIKDKDLQLIAVAGTHGKTTTTGMFVWALQQLGVLTSYSVGSTVSFGPSGAYAPGSQYFVYECDEFDRNMLQFYPQLSVITSLDYDHADTYPTVADYRASFVQFLEQSDFAVLWEKDLRYLATPTLDTDSEAYDELMDLSRFTLIGNHNRHNAFLVERALLRLLPDTDVLQLTAILNAFPGTGRRFEKLADNLYSDYGHHPVEIVATRQLAHELNDRVVLVYQPHQNVRQQEIKNQYPATMQGFDTIYWLPTYLSREQADQAVLTPEQLSAGITDPVIISNTDETLWTNIEKERAAGKLVLVMGAGSIDDWIRQQLAVAI